MSGGPNQILSGMEGFSAYLGNLGPDQDTALQSPESRMWLTVMIHNFNDAMWEDDYNTGIRSFIDKFNARAQARAFLRGRTEGFHLICQAAGLDPDRMRIVARDTFGDALDDPYVLLDANAAEALLGDRIVEFVE